MIRRIHHQKRSGAVAPLTAIVMIVLLAMVAFAVDIGYLNVVRGQAQNCADSAALAGAGKLAERLKNAPIVKGIPVQTVDDLRAAVQEAKDYAQRNNVGGVSIQLNDGDIEIGYMADPFNHSNNTLDKSGWPARPYNAVRVNVARDANHNGGKLKLFFAPVIGVDDADVRATATACLPMGDPVPHAKGLLPFAYQVDEWKAVLGAPGPGTYKAANGKTVTLTDNFSVDGNSTNALGVKCGSDGKVETRMYPQSTTSGNYGTINFSKTKSGNSTSDLRDIIMNGPKEADWPDLPEILTASPTKPVTVNGDPGISAGMEPAVRAIIGQPRFLPLYTTVSGNGNNSYFRLVGFAPVTIVDVKLSGRTKYIAVQPRTIYNKSIISGDNRIDVTIIPSANPNPLVIGRCVLVR